MMQEAPVRVVVVGSGLAGYGVLREVRRLAPDAMLTLVTGDDGHFYSKPALSTALAKEKAPDTLITTAAEKMREQIGFTLQARTRVEAIDRETRVLRTSGGPIAYDKLVLALGADPLRPPIAGNAAERVLSVNSLEDYRAFRERLPADADILIMGAGLVGSEFANDLAAAGHRPHLVDPLPHPLAQLVPEDVGREILGGLSAVGVQGHFGCRVVSLDVAGRRVAATLDDGTVIDADLVLSAIGLRPHVTLAEQAGLDVGRGIKVDATGRTGDPHIYAIGDCAEYERGLAAYVTPIMAAARGIAPSLLGTPTAIRFPPLSVQVKTTACPTVLLPPPTGHPGRWRAAEQDEDGLKYLFEDGEGRIAGYALTGARCTERGDLDRLIANAAEARL